MIAIAGAGKIRLNGAPFRSAQPFQDIYGLSRYDDVRFALLVSDKIASASGPDDVPRGKGFKLNGI